MLVVYLKWLDSSNIDGDVRPNQASTEGLLEMETTGFLVGEDDAAIRVVQHTWSYNDSGGANQIWFRRLAVIPKSMVTQRVEWPIPNEKAP